jgi:Flp pilus assembly pilin Flp
MDRENRDVSFVSDDSGQGFIEYVVLVSLVLFAATATYALFQAIRGRFETATSRLESLPYE